MVLFDRLEFVKKYQPHKYQLAYVVQEYVTIINVTIIVVKIRINQGKLLEFKSAFFIYKLHTQHIILKSYTKIHSMINMIYYVTLIFQQESSVSALGDWIKR